VWVAVTAPTKSAVTPHEHIYLWIDDPQNDVTAENLEPALAKYLEYCVNAYRDDHRYRSDGTDGAITFQHSLELADHIPDNILEIIDGETPARPNTTGVCYLSNQLAHLQLADMYSSAKPDPPTPLIDGAVTCWLSPHHWFRTSSGFPV